jgi:hypothetical protein
LTLIEHMRKWCAPDPTRRQRIDRARMVLADALQQRLISAARAARPAWRWTRSHRRPERLVLRHQLNVLTRKSPKRVAVSNIDRLVFCGLYRLSPKVLGALKILQPETVIRWHRAGFRAYWRSKSRPRGGRPKTPADIRQLILEMSVEVRFRSADPSQLVFARPAHGDTDCRLARRQALAPQEIGRDPADFGALRIDCEDTLLKHHDTLNL